MTFHVDLYPVVLSDEKRSLDVDAGGTVADMLADRHAAVTINNVIVKPEEYATREPIEGDYVVIRALPTAAGVAAIASIGSALASAAAAAGGFLGLSALTWTAISIGISVVGGLVARSMVEPPSKPQRPESNRLPGITGQSNQIDPFGTVDKIYGEMRVIPKLGAKPFTEIAGDDQFLRMLFVIGEGPLDFSESDIQIGSTSLTNFVGYSAQIRHGWPSDPPQTIVKNVVDQQTVGVPLNTRGDRATRETSRNTEEISVDMTAPAGLTMLENDSGDMRVCDVGFYVYVDGQEANISDTTGAVNKGDIYYGDGGHLSGTIHMSGKTRDTLRGSFRIDVPAGQHTVEIVRTWTVEEKYGGGESFFYSEGELAGESTDITWTVLRSFVANDEPMIDFDHPVALLALRIKATDQLNGVIDNLSVKVRSLHKIPGQSGWNPTSNPIWHYRDALTSWSADTRVPVSQIDDSTLQQAADFCTARGYEFNAVVNPSDRYSVISQILSFARASLDMSNGLFSVIWEHEQPARQMFTPRNSWDFSGNRAYPKIPDALRTRYLDKRTWETNEVIVYRDGYNKSNAKHFETFDISYGCTDNPPPVTTGDINNHQSIRMAYEKLREAQLRLENFKFTTDLEWLAVGRGGRVKHAHDAILIGLGSARIVSIVGNEVTFDQTFEMAAGKNYGIEVRNSRGEVYAVNVEDNPGIWDAVTVVDPLPDTIASGDLVAFGETDKITQDLIIKTISPDSEREASLELVPYAPEIYNINLPLPEYDANITEPVDIKSLPPGGVSIELIRSDESVLKHGLDGTLIPQMVVVTTAESGTDVPTGSKQVRYRKLIDGEATANWEYLTFGRTERIVIPDVDQGETYEVQVRNVTPWHKYSDWATATETVVGKTTRPPDVANFRAAMENFSVRLRWGAANVVDVAGYIVEQKVGGTWQRLNIADSLTMVIDVLPTQGATSKTYEFRIKTLDKAGLVSKNWVYDTVTVNTPDAPSVKERFDGANLILTWDKPNSEFPISHYIVYRNGVPVDQPKTQLFSTIANWLGTLAWGVSAVDVAGNIGAITTVMPMVRAPTVAMDPSQVIGNDVLLYWDGTPSTLPIDHYEIYKGDNAPNRLQGTSDSTFTSLAETESGTYTYWVIAVDTAGNKSDPDSITNEVSAPKGFDLFAEFVETFNIAYPTFFADFQSQTYYTSEGNTVPEGQISHNYTNVLQEPGELILPVNTTQTWEQHFTSNNWSTPQDQINAGYPIYAQPSENTATLEFVYDVGTVVPASKISLNPDYVVIDGSPNITFDIDIKQNQSDPWTTHNNVTQIYETQFRYIRVTVHVSSPNNKGIIEFRKLITTVSVTVIEDRGTVQMTGNPTHVSFNKTFLDVEWLSATIIDGTAGTVNIDFNDVPNPTGFDLYAYDLNGNPITPKVSWAAEGN